MKNLPLLLLGAGAVYFIAKKPTKVPTTTSTAPKKDNVETKSESDTAIKRQGYQIKDCVLIISNKQEAYDYAFKYGASFDKGPGDELDLIKKELFGDCLDTIGSTKKLVGKYFDYAIFVFNMFKNAYSGAAKINAFADKYKERLFKIRDSLNEITGYFIPDKDVEIIEVI